MADKSIWISLQLDESLKQRAATKAKKQHVSLSHWIRELMRKALEGK